MARAVNSGADESHSGGGGKGGGGGEAASIRAYQLGPSLPVLSAAPRERLLKYVDAVDQLFVVEKNTFRALEPKTLRDSRLQTCDSDIVALEYIPLGGLHSVSNKSHVLAVATNRVCFSFRCVLLIDRLLLLNSQVFLCFGAPYLPSECIAV
jgi:hypothetical protein